MGDLAFGGGFETMKNGISHDDIWDILESEKVCVFNMPEGCPDRAHHKFEQNASLRRPDPMASTAAIPVTNGIQNASDDTYFFSQVRQAPQGLRFDHEGYLPLPCKRKLTCMV